MITSQDLAMFESVARSHPQLRAWLERELETEIKALIQMNDGEQIKRVQGRAQVMQTLIENLSRRS